MTLSHAAWAAMERHTEAELAAVGRVTRRNLFKVAERAVMEETGRYVMSESDGRIVFRAVTRFVRTKLQSRRNARNFRIRGEYVAKA